MQTKNNFSNYKNIKRDGEVTVIIAAYLRYDSLNITLQSVYNQTYKKWNVLIIADCCDDHFIKNVDLSDSRVRLVNLPKRCGNQYGPNSVGIHIAKSEYIAFLNHDDLWLSDHLETALNIMDNNSSDFFLGRAAFCHSKNQEKRYDHEGRLLFSEINKPEAIWRCITGPNMFFEPASSWVIKTQLAKNIGYWLSPNDVNNTPVMNWLSRAAKDKTKFCFSKDVTTLKFNLHHSAPKISLLKKIGYKLHLNKVNKIPAFNWLFGIIRIQSSSSPRYLNQESDLGMVEYYLHLHPNKIRNFIKIDINEAEKNELVTRKKLVKPIVMDNVEKQKIKKFEEFIKSGIKEEKTKKYSISSTKKFNSTIYLRTGEKISTFVSSETIINELHKLEII